MQAIATPKDWRIHKLIIRGFTVDQTSLRTGVRKSEVLNAVARVILAKEHNRTANDDGVKPPKLIPTFGSTCKPLALLRCSDIHPCRECDGGGCEACEGTGVGKLDGNLTKFCCGVCYRSGWDFCNRLNPFPFPIPDEPEAEDTPLAVAG